MIDGMGDCSSKALFSDKEENVEFTTTHNAGVQAMFESQKSYKQQSPEKNKCQHTSTRTCFGFNTDNAEGNQIY